MLEHFESFFIFVFQIKAIVYVLPLAMKFQKDSSLLIYNVASLLAIYKSYSSILDILFKCPYYHFGDLRLSFTFKLTIYL